MRTISIRVFVLAAGTIATAGCGSNSGRAGTDTSAVTSGGSVGAGGFAAPGGASASGGTTGSSGTPAAGAMANVGGTFAGGTSAVDGGATSAGGVITTGGSKSAGGSTTAGGAIATGGSKSAGGAATTGGSTNVGGAPTTGATWSEGGMPAVGGASIAGGTNPGGGTSATGGTKAAGGSATAGAPMSGGTKAAGGTAGSSATTAAAGATSACRSVSEFDSWDAGKDPVTIGKAAVGDFAKHTSDAWTTAGYALAFSWYGALRFNKVHGDSNTSLITAFDNTLGKNPPSDVNANPKVDVRAFGVLPLEIYIQNSVQSYRDLGVARADIQWTDKGASGDPNDFRYWSDDMYMITGLQVQAYRATGNQQTYLIDHAAYAMLKYLPALQPASMAQPPTVTYPGLFYHTKDVKVYWGRANGWFAAGMAEMLLELPTGATRDTIMKGFKSQMDDLLKVQISSTDDNDGCWRQVLDLATTASKPESSCTAMFTYALVNAVKNGWLTDAKYAQAAHRGWTCIAKMTGTDGKLANVCPGTGAADSSKPFAEQQKHYTDIALQPGDLHGQAPLLWAATALVRADCPGVR